MPSVAYISNTEIRRCRGNSPLGRICNPTAISMSICNAERKRITNPYTRCCRISNPAERIIYRTQRHEDAEVILIDKKTLCLRVSVFHLSYHLIFPRLLRLDIPLGGLGGFSLITSHFSLKHPPRGLGGFPLLGGFPSTRQQTPSHPRVSHAAWCIRSGSHASDDRDSVHFPTYTWAGREASSSHRYRASWPAPLSV